MKKQELPDHIRGLDHLMQETRTVCEAILIKLSETEQLQLFALLYELRPQLQKQLLTAAFRGQLTNILAILVDQLPKEDEVIAFEVLLGDEEKLVEFLENWRRRQGLTQVQLAGELGISQSFLSQVLKRKKSLSPNKKQAVIEWILFQALHHIP
jgi:antitoxin component HigA of HigAB toxin-antitoxin module